MSDVASEHDDSLDKAWKWVLKNSDKAVRGWLRNSRLLTRHESHVMLAVPSEFLRERIETRHRSGIEELLSDYFKRIIYLGVTVEPDLELPLEPEENEFEADVEPVVYIQSEHTPNRRETSETTTEPRNNGLNPKYTFDNFIIGPSNRFAHAAAVAVAEAPGKAYNPLLIYGDSGLGKTHLLQAIGQYMLEYYEGVKVKYVSTEEMTNDFINAIYENRTAEFRRKYRDDVDVLLIDDIQFLASKTQTQEEFFHTFNTLHTAQKQIVMTCDRPPKALETLENRLRSRFEWGLITDIQPPDLETRIAILRKNCSAEHLTVTEDVLQLIAEKIQSNIRELEVALLRVSAYSSLERKTVDLKTAEDVLRAFITVDEGAEVTVSRIIEETAAYFGFTPNDILGTSRTQLLVKARQIAMYLSRELTELGLPKIGEEFGGKDHSTVMHACKKIKNQMSERRNVYDDVSKLTNEIKASPI